jgi:hypothetical protein
MLQGTGLLNIFRSKKFPDHFRLAIACRRINKSPRALLTADASRLLAFLGIPPPPLRDRSLFAARKYDESL